MGGTPLAYILGGCVDSRRLTEYLALYDTAWLMDGYVQWLHGPHAVIVGAVRPASGTLHGALFAERRDKHIRLSHVSVEPGSRRRKVATNLLYRLLLDPLMGRFKGITALCPDNQDAAIWWLRSGGFKAISVIGGDGGPDSRDQYLFYRPVSLGASCESP